MPELPEVETIKEGIKSHLMNKVIQSVSIRNKSLRWPIEDTLPKNLIQKIIVDVIRRGKYILIQLSEGMLVIHLGMSGKLSFTEKDASPKKHDHVNILLNDNLCLRYNDPRRFGSIHYSNTWLEHPLLDKLGPEPLGPHFTEEYFFKKVSQKRRAIKITLMDAHIVVGVGNIYANEALFTAGIQPTRLSNTLNMEDCRKIVVAVKDILSRAIQQGGTTLKDFFSADGSPGYFAQSLNVYGRGNKSCFVCGSMLQEIKLGQRQTVYCERCQK